MPQFELNKLVRDKLPEIYKSLGQEASIEKLSNLELSRALLDKLIEEASEITPESSREEILEEVADLQQVIDDFKAENNITDEQVADARANKKDKSGGFRKGMFVKTLIVPDGDNWVEYYRKDPEKYPEI